MHARHAIVKVWRLDSVMLPAVVDPGNAPMATKYVGKAQAGTTETIEEARNGWAIHVSS